MQFQPSYRFEVPEYASQLGPCFVTLVLLVWVVIAWFFAVGLEQLLTNLIKINYTECSSKSDLKIWLLCITHRHDLCNPEILSDVIYDHLASNFGFELLFTRAFITLIIIMEGIRFVWRTASEGENGELVESGYKKETLLLRNLEDLDEIDVLRMVMRLAFVRVGFVKIWRTWSQQLSRIIFRGNKYRNIFEREGISLRDLVCSSVFAIRLRSILCCATFQWLHEFEFLQD